MLINAIKSEVAMRLVAADQPPKVLTAACVVGTDRATELFESAYDEHARRMATLYAPLGRDQPARDTPSRDIPSRDMP